MTRISSSALSILIIFLLFLTIFLGVVFVQFSIEQKNIATDLLSAERNLAKQKNIHDKLELEYARLLDPDNLIKKAPLFGLHVARPYQIRKILSNLEPQEGTN